MRERRKVGRRWAQGSRGEGEEEAACIYFLTGEPVSTGSGLYYGRQKPRLAPVRVSQLLLMMVNIFYGPVPHMNEGPFFFKGLMESYIVPLIRVIIVMENPKPTNVGSRGK